MVLLVTYMYIICRNIKTVFVNIPHCDLRFLCENLRLTYIIMV